MNSNISPTKPRIDRTMKPEQFNQVVEAIASGRYSWACLLILRFAGYNPLHYIPYRTYSRLIRENKQISQPTDREIKEIIEVKQVTVSGNNN